MLSFNRQLFAVAIAALLVGAAPIVDAKPAARKSARIAKSVKIAKKSKPAVRPYVGAPVRAEVARSNKAALVQAVRERGGNDVWPSRVVEELMDFQMSQSAWKVMLSESGVKVASDAARNINEYAKRLGLGDLEAVETADGSDRAGNQGAVGETLARLESKFALWVAATQPNLSESQGALMLRYLSFIPEHMNRGQWQPRGGEANIRFVLSPVAKDIAVSMSAARTQFTVSAPSKAEPDGWDSKIEKGLDRGK